MKKLIFILLAIITFASCEQEKFTLFLKTDNVEGLKTGNEVLINGLKVGEVSEIELNKSYQIIVKAVFEKEQFFPIDSKFNLISTDFLGTKGIDIIIGKETQFLNSKDSIILNPMPDFSEQIDSTMIKIMENAIEQFSTNNVIDSLTKELKEINEKLDKQN